MMGILMVLYQLIQEITQQVLLRIVQKVLLGIARQALRRTTRRVGETSLLNAEIDLGLGKEKEEKVAEEHRRLTVPPRSWKRKGRDQNQSLDKVTSVEDDHQRPIIAVENPLETD
jgi:hypothetical protein